MAKPVAPKKPNLLILHIELLGIEPAIWRRVAVPENITLTKLHHVIQLTMGWENSHQHQYLIAGEHYGIPDGYLPIKPQARKTLLKTLNGELAFDYLYDFGDGWEHRITVEATIPAPPRKRVPYCIDGANACPPEDVGGPHGYEDFRAAMLDSTHPGYHDAHDWYGPWLFTPERFIVREANEYLRDLLP